MVIIVCEFRILSKKVKDKAYNGCCSDSYHARISTGRLIAAAGFYRAKDRHVGVERGKNSSNALVPPAFTP